ncbi:nucleocapsid protein [Glossina pallidipes salivary gland hypertrophy virus]|uniref:Nucleocapsid protein n=2 Tax=Glossina hytrovirus (isolate Glossina pallidipes/Ethiopia/Seibersdorf/-) TaxID=379529 RepID=A0A0Y0J9X1_GHVS|nr:hypothetical protein SGHV101 [Glossina pallidipes salivary gland hypertrophy virus]ABQ08874.1 hypothetical protein SGHV101 [Glossina pallidipes salivary gland hypertrophy virus]AMB48715.1 nucleocapsid protein [Glossina pallidipes salivary gland hypertrophy virus]
MNTLKNYQNNNSELLQNKKIQVYDADKSFITDNGIHVNARISAKKSNTIVLNTLLNFDKVQKIFPVKSHYYNTVITIDYKTRNFIITFYIIDSIIFEVGQIVAIFE